MSRSAPSPTTPHILDTLRSWARRLEMFRFVRSYGGLANDGDQLVIAFRYSSPDELLRFFEFLRIELVVLDACPPQPELGRSYPGDVFAQFPLLIPGTRWIEQPRHPRIGGEEVFISCSRDRVWISRFDGYEVTEADVTAAEKVEAHLVGAPLERVEPPVDNDRCICPKYHPDCFL